ncbi:MAG: HD domain-containing protein [Sedimentisphaerales bacterium]
MFRCPGQDPRFWKPGDIFDVKCPGCGKSVEFFKDEPNTKCRNCGKMVANPKLDLGCAQWCQYAVQCVAASGVKNISIIRDKIIDEMKKVFGKDQKRIERALAVLNYAEQIQAAEGGDPLVVRAAAILHDIGIQQAEKKYGSSAGNYQETEGHPIARKILQNYGLTDEIIERTCKIIANHHSAKDVDTLEFRIVWDADWLVNIPDELSGAGKAKLISLIDKTFKTKTGRQIAVKSFIETS